MRHSTQETIIDIHPQKQVNRRIAVMTIPGLSDTNTSGVVSGAWIYHHMDRGVGVIAMDYARGQIVTKASNIVYHDAVFPGEVLTVYCNLEKKGNTSLTFKAEAWSRDNKTSARPRMIAMADFIFVAIDGKNKPRKI